MPKYAAVLEFGEDIDLLHQTRPDHRAYLQTLLDEGKLWMSGPWTDDTGALLIYDAEDIASAQALLDADPYRRAGVVANARLKEWRLVFQQPAGD